MFSIIVRFIEFFVLLSVIRSVVGTVQRFFSGPRSSGPVQRRSGAGAQMPATVLQQDPVCGTYLAVDTSLKKIVGGKVLHFCSAECRDRCQG